MSLENENYNVGGMGGALFADSSVPARRPQPVGQHPIGDEYRAPVGLPEWKKPSFDDDDRVDPDKYPEPKSGPVPNFLGRFFPDEVSQGLFAAKLFYFFFFAAFGSLFPLMAVYFKQLGMDTAQCGFLIGIRPIVEYLATPFWNNIAERFRKGKIMFLLALGCWILFTEPIGHIHPPVVSCKYWNGTNYLLKLPNTYTRRKRGVMYDELVLTSQPVAVAPLMSLKMTEEEMSDKIASVDILDDDELPFITNLQNAWLRTKRDVPDDIEAPSVSPHWLPGHVVGKSPQIIDFAVNYQQNRHQQWISPAFNNEVFERSAVHKVFFLIALLVIIGEFFSSPAVALADSAVITLLGEENQDKYSSQRMFGSIGWGFSMFIMGMVLDHSRIFQDAKCNMNEGQKNYNVCFTVFSTLMGLALIVATQLPFKYSSNAPKDPASIPLNNLNPSAPQKQKTQEQKDKLKEMATKTKVFAQQLRSMPEFTAVFRALTNLRLLMCMLVAWVMGIGMGLIFTFLFWHLQEYGGSPTLFGIASVINHISEMAAYFYSFQIINKIGHVKVLAAGLLCNSLRFLYISVITWPWLVLPFEFVQGITHAAVWAACCSFIAHNTSPELRPSAQGFLQGVHHGFGKFCGSVFGGMLIKEHGSIMVFRVYGVVCAVFLLLFVLVNFYNRNEGSFTTALPDELDPKNMAQEGTHLEPHGVPSSGRLGMPRALSDNKLEEQPLQTQAEGFGANLEIPGVAANNPFLEDIAYDASGMRVPDQGQYYGRGYTQAQSGYSSSGFGY